VIVPLYVREQLFARRQDNDDVLGALTVPALITHGGSDRIVLPDAAEQHAALIGHARNSVYRDTGHAPFAEDPDRFNRELREFAGSCRR
jgi:non-heme chloroperoxidase